MNRNNGRAGIPEDFLEDSSPPTPHTQGTDSTAFSWTTPTEFVDLPSGGAFYGPGHPLHGQHTVEINYMTAKEEDILTSKALIKQGVVIDRLLQSVLADRSINVNSLLVGDKNALLVATRITGYGAEYLTTVTCPSCAAASDYEFDLSEVINNDFAAMAEEHSVTFSEEGTFTVDLPLTKATVECRMLTGADEAKITREAERKVRRKLEESNLTDQFRAFIVSVNGDNSPFIIASFVQAMPARDSRLLRKVYSDVVPGIDMTQNYECGSCGHSADMEVPLTADFFWPR